MLRADLGDFRLRTQAHFAYVAQILGRLFEALIVRVALARDALTQLFRICRQCLAGGEGVERTRGVDVECSQLLRGVQHDLG